MLWCIFITYIITHHGLGGLSGLINGLIAAAIGALSMLMSEPTAKSYVKSTCMFVLSIATFTLHYNQSTSKESLIIIFSFYSGHEVVVEKIEIASICLTSSLPDNILCYNEAMANGDRYYFAARFEGDKEQVPRKFVVGDGEIYGGYINAPLEPSCKTDY